MGNISLNNGRTSRGMTRGIVTVVLCLLIIASVVHMRQRDLIAFTTPQILMNSQPPNGEALNAQPQTAQAAQEPNAQAPPGKPAYRPSFLEIAKKYGTDKVSTHSYHHMYHKYLEPLRDQPLKMLEIGLGCDMGYGPGASYYTWLEFLPNVDLYYIEYDAKCAKKWASKTTGATIFPGDQANVTFLNEFLEATGGNFDVIIDDGGHSMNQQLTSIDTLFKSVKPNGVYFIEDLQTSYMDFGYGGGEKKEGTTMERIKTSLEDIMPSRPMSEPMKETWSIDCMREVCAFHKKVPGVVY